MTKKCIGISEVVMQQSIFVLLTVGLPSAPAFIWERSTRPFCSAFSPSNMAPLRPAATGTPTQSHQTVSGPLLLKAHKASLRGV